MGKVSLIPLTKENREWFIINNQKAFKYGATEEFGVRDEHFEDGDEIISRETIERAISVIEIIFDAESFEALISLIIFIFNSFKTTYGIIIKSKSVKSVENI